MKNPSERDQKRQDAKAKFKKFVLYYALVAIPICLVIMFWPMADNVTGHGKAAHYIAIPLAFVLGLGFMSAMFFSSNSGGDEQPNYVEMAERQKREDAQRRRGNKD
jgi:ACR3 family arsenite efflux pump ArsB